MTPQAVRSQFSHLYGSTMLPVLDRIHEFEYNRYPSLREALFQVKSVDRDISQSTELHDMDLFMQVPEGTEYTFKRFKQGLSKTYTHLKWGLGISISEETIDDGRFDLAAKMVKKLARSAYETQEISAMNIFNNGFGTSGDTPADGLSLFNTAHTLPSGGTFRNQLSTNSDLSPTSLDTALTDFDTQFVGDSGIFYRIRPKTLLVPQGLVRYASELVNSSNKVDSSDNNINSLQMANLQVVASPHLTDTDAWFLVADSSDTGLVLNVRKALETKAAGPDQGFTTDSMFYKSRFRESIGADHAYGIIGTPGAP